MLSFRGRQLQVIQLSGCCRSSGSTSSTYCAEQPATPARVARDCPRRLYHQYETDLLSHRVFGQSDLSLPSRTAYCPGQCPSGLDIA